MRSPYPTPGRNTALETIWRTITAFTRALVPGSQRSLVTTPNTQYPNDVTTLQRQYDLEISEYPVRDYLKAKQLIEINEYCPEAATARDIIRKSCLLSEDGDDFGFTIAKTLSDKVTPIDPKIYSILMRLIDTTLQGQTLEPAVDRMIAYGDAFCSIGLSKGLDRVEKGACHLCRSIREPSPPAPLPSLGEGCKTPVPLLPTLGEGVRG